MLTNWQILSPYQLQELIPGLLALEENAGEGRSCCDGVGLLDAAHTHTGVHGFDDDGNAKGVEGFLDAVPDLLSEALLDLEAAGIGFHHAGNLAEAGDLAVGDVCHVGLADEGEHMVLAQGE